MRDGVAIRALRKVDWNFADYRSNQFPVDINSIHWYPAAFPPQIPAVLIDSLSEVGDVVLDPFMGAGTTIIEASRLGRRFIGIDCNPYAVNIAEAKLFALSVVSERWYSAEQSAVTSLCDVEDLQKYCSRTRINTEVFKWFHPRTLSEILSLHEHILLKRGGATGALRRSALSAILNRSCSQRDHYTYITDSCYPREMIYRNARELYRQQIDLIGRAAHESRRQFARVRGKEWKPLADGAIFCRDARQLDWLSDGCIDLVLTSPPYLGVNDYIRSMRLTSLFFPEEEIDYALEAEIGARRKRNRRSAFEDYLLDMGRALGEISRVLKKSGYLALVLGRGKGNVNKENLIKLIKQMLTSEYGFAVLFEEERRIKFRRIQVPGVGTERILILRR